MDITPFLRRRSVPSVSCREARMLAQTTSPPFAESPQLPSQENMNPEDAAKQILTISENNLTAECQQFIKDGVNGANDTVGRAKGTIQHYLQQMTDVYTKVIREPMEAAGMVEKQQSMPALFQEKIRDNVLHHSVIRPLIEALGFRPWFAYGQIGVSSIPPKPTRPPVEPQAMEQPQAPAAEDESVSEDAASRVLTFEEKDSGQIYDELTHMDPAVRDVKYHESPATDVHLGLLANNANIESINLNNVSLGDEMVTNAGVSLFENHENLKTLKLYAKEIDNSVVQKLPKNLTALEIGKTGITADALNALAARCQKLAWLSLDELNVENKISELQSLSNLKELHLSSATISDGDIRNLKDFPALRFLSLYEVSSLSPDNVRVLLDSSKINQLKLSDSIHDDIKSVLEEKGFIRAVGQDSQGYSFNWEKNEE